MLYIYYIICFMYLVIYKIYIYIIYILCTYYFFNTVNKSECIKHVVFDCALNVSSWNVANIRYINIV